MASIAETGFGLSGLCIGESRGYGKAAAIRDRVRQTLRFLKGRLPNERGFFYHFIDIETGERVWNCELSSIDSSLLLCGVLTARQHFNDAEIQDLATAIYERVDWPWVLNDSETFSMGWKPQGGFLRSRWEHYCELMMIFLLAIGSAYAFCSERNVEGVGTSYREVSGIRMYFRVRSTVYSSVLTSVI